MSRNIKKIGIIQPGRLGDLIILLPAVKYYADRNYEVYWPIFKEYINMFREVVNYVNFISLENNMYNCISTAYEKLKEYNIEEIKDIAFTFPGSKATKEYIERGDGLKESFDNIKYDMLGVPFEEKWNLNIKRNIEKENELYNKLVKNPKYAVVCLNYSGGKINVNLDESDGQVIHVTENYNIFHWIKILENASTIALVESSMVNLVEQLNLPNRKILFTKPENPSFPGPRPPVLRNNWIKK